MRRSWSRAAWAWPSSDGSSASCTTPESVSADYFRNAVQLADRFGLIASDEPGLKDRRTAFADELRQITRRLDTLRRIAQAAGQPVLTERAPRPQGGRRG